MTQHEVMRAVIASTIANHGACGEGITPFLHCKNCPFAEVSAVCGDHANKRTIAEQWLIDHPEGKETSIGPRAVGLPANLWDKAVHPARKSKASPKKGWSIGILGHRKEARKNILGRS